MQDGVNRLSNSCSGWKSQKYLTFGSSVAYYWGDSLKAAQSSINQMISIVQNSKRAA
jgi:hypothetical protein